MLNKNRFLTVIFSSILTVIFSSMQSWKNFFTSEFEYIPSGKFSNHFESLDYDVAENSNQKKVLFKVKSISF